VSDSTTRIARTIAATGIVLTLVAIALIVRQALTPQHRAPYFGTPIDPPKSASDAVLIDDNGRPAHLLDPAFPSTFVFFGYTHCPDECPLALASLAKAYRGLSPAAQARTRIVFVSVDPARDSPAVMKSYVGNFAAPITGLTGSDSQLAPVWKDYGVEVEPQSRELAHGDAIYAIDASNHVVLIYTPDVSAKNLRADAERLALSR
jgi:protein SCO1/2